MGAGYGISRYDSDGDWHGIYIMAFKDSFNKWEPIGGYAYEKIWRPLDDKDFRRGWASPPASPRVTTGNTFLSRPAAAGLYRLSAADVPGDLHSRHL